MTKPLITLLLFLLAILSGILLTKAGRPLNTWIFAVHKLAALALIVLSIILIKYYVQVIDLKVLFVVISGFLLLSIFTTGAFLSFDKFAITPLRLFHATIPAAIAVFIGVVIWILRLK